MNLRNISANQIAVWSALLLGLLVSVMIGSAVGSSDVRMVAGALSLIPATIIFVKLKTNIWVLIPIGWYLGGRLPWLPLPFTVRDLCMLIAIFSFTLFIATRVFPWKRKVNTLDYFIYINLAYLATVYARNPAGFWAMQTSTVGGRPYFEIALAFGAYLVLSRVNISDFIAKSFPWFFLIPAWSVGILDVASRLSPQTGLVLNSLYSGFGSGGIASALQPDAQLGQTRMTGLLVAGVSSVLALSAKYGPSTLISPLYPGRFLMLLAAVGAILLSGFRSGLLFGMVILLFSAILRRQIKDLWVFASVLILLLTAVIATQGSIVQFPLTMQRALSWLPGDWNKDALADAQGSSQWRFEMWGWAWNDERILQDRTWGQGFGLSLEDMNLVAASLMAGQGGSSLLGGSDRELFMITGMFHSGPLSAIKFIGVVGLALYYPLMCYMAWLAWRLCKRARGTEAFTLSLFIGIPIIYEPFNFVIIFGGLDSNYPQLLFWAGLLNMLSNYISSLTEQRQLRRANVSQTDYLQDSKALVQAAQAMR